MAHDDQDFVVLEDQDLADFNAAGLLPQSSGTIDQILRWLKLTDYTADSSEYNKHLSSYVPGKWPVPGMAQFRLWRLMD
jgi:hypothetical protein